jgi:hypothetical protein
MIKFGSYSTTLMIPFNEFYNQFNEELHFKLQGIKKKWFNPITVEQNTPKYIRVWERKALHCNYYPDEQGNTVVEYTAEMTVLSLLIWITSLFFLVGFVFFPFYFFGNKFAASLCKKKVFKNGPSCIRSILSSSNIKNEPEINLTKKTTVPPPVKNNADLPPRAKKITPPPAPKKTVAEMYYVLINDEQKGPFTIEKIGLLIEVDQVNTTSLVWKEGMSDWVNASQIERINEFFE